AYVEVVSGDAKTQAMLRQFCFDGLVRWKLGSIIEGLPLILHSSVAMFLVGLSLYVSQISVPISTMISVITAGTFVFYLATSTIPVFFLDCPFRISSLVVVARPLRKLLRALLYALCNGLMKVFPNSHRVIPGLFHYSLPFRPLATLKMDEYEHATLPVQGGDWKSLSWLLSHSTNNSTKDIVTEGVSGLLDRLKGTDNEPLLLSTQEPRSLLLRVLVYSANRQEELEGRANGHDIIHTTWNAVITQALLTASRLDLSFSYPEKTWYMSRYLSDSPHQWQHFATHIWKRYVAAHREQSHEIGRYCLKLMLDVKLHMGRAIRSHLCLYGSQDDIRCAMAQQSTRDLLLKLDDHGYTPLHTAVSWGKLETVIALVETTPGLINAQTLDSQTALDQVWRTADSFDPRVLEYLLDNGANAPPSTLHLAAASGQSEGIQVLLDRGWDRTFKDESGALPVDLARADSISSYFFPDRFNTAIEYLENYQTVPLPHPKLLVAPPTTSHIREVPAGLISFGQVVSRNDVVGV
ncbi:hypothetical protein H0H93_008102, partial [Arthromyces matolae]